MLVSRGLSKLSFRTLSLTAYALTFSALFGVAVGYTVTLSDGSADTGMLYVWALIGFIGSLLMVAKNRRIHDPALRRRFIYTDPAVVLAALVLIAVLPNSIGLLRGLILLGLLSAYGYWYFKCLQAQLWP